MVPSPYEYAIARGQIGTPKPAATNAMLKRGGGTAALQRGSEEGAGGLSRLARSVNQLTGEAEIVWEALLAA